MCYLSAFYGATIETKVHPHFDRYHDRLACHCMRRTKEKPYEAQFLVL